MATYTALACMEDVAGRLAALVQGTFTATSTTALTAAAYPFMSNRSDASNQTFEGDEILETGTAVAVPNPNGIGAYVASTGVFTPSLTYTTKPGSTGTFDIFTRGVTRALLLRNLNRALRRLRYRTTDVLTYVPDGDMDASGTANYTGTNATLSKDVATSFETGVRRGVSSLKATYTSANGYATLATGLQVDATWAPQWYVEVMVRAASSIGNSETCTLQAYDLTNLAVIASKAWSNGDWGKLGMTFALPSGCLALSFRLVGSSATTLGFWDDLIAFPIGATELPLPTWVNEEYQIERILMDIGERDRADRDTPSPVMYWEVRPDESSPTTQFRLKLWEPTHGPLWIQGQRPYPALTADTDTTFADRDWIVQQALVYTLEELIAQPGQETKHWQEMWAREVQTAKRMNASRMSVPRLHINWGSPPRTPYPIHRGYQRY